MEKLSSLHNKEILKFGLISALVSILVLAIIYILGAEYFMSPLVWISSFSLPIIFIVLGCIEVKKKKDGYLEFKEALKISFGILVMTSLASSVFSFVLMNYIDVTYAETVKQLTIEKTMEFMQKFKVPESEIDKQIDELIKQDIFSFGNLAKSFANTCIVYFIEALIVSAIIKKKRPEIEF